MTAIVASAGVPGVLVDATAGQEAALPEGVDVAGRAVAVLSG